MSYRIEQIRFAGYPFYEVYQDDKSLGVFPSEREANVFATSLRGGIPNHHLDEHGTDFTGAFTELLNEEGE